MYCDYHRMLYEYAIYRRMHHLIHIDLSLIVMVWLWTAQDKISFYFNGSYSSYELMNRLMNNHCLKVFGLLALNILLYLFWLALGELLIIGNRIALSLYKMYFLTEVREFLSYLCTQQAKTKTWPNSSTN